MENDALQRHYENLACEGGFEAVSYTHLDVYKRQTQGDPAFSAAVGLVAFFAAMSRCPVTAFLMGCEIFGWAAAPAFALAVAVSFSLGRDVGLYGRGATGILKRATSAARARLVVKKP